MRTGLAIRSVLAVLLPCSVALAQGFTTSPFAPDQVLGGGVFLASRPAAGDMDGDGLPELVTHIDNEANDIGVQIYTNSAGVLTAPLLHYPAPTSFFPLDIELGDLDGDGDLDVVTGQGSGLIALRGAGDGTLLPWAMAASLPPTTLRCDLGDMDADGALDVVVGHGQFGGTAVSIAPGLGDATFGPAVLIATGFGTGGVQLVRAADLDGDGRLDVGVQSVPIFVPKSTTDVLRNDGSSFSKLPVPATLATVGVGLDVADFDHDGRSDLLLTAGNQGFFVALGQGAGSFGVPALVAGNKTLGDVVAVDVDLDGFADVLGERAVQRMGPGAQPVGAALSLEAMAKRYVVADFDGDALPDAACLHNTDWPPPAWQRQNILGPQIDIGFGTQGGPTLQITGAPLPSQAATILVSGPPTGTPAILIVGGQPLHALLGAVDLVPAPDVVLAVPAGIPLATRWPATLLPGSPLYVQAAVLSPAPAVSHALVIVP